MDTTNPDADLDYKMYVQNPAGEECVVSPANKYCAYAQHFFDATPLNPGVEIMYIKDLAVAKYKTTIEPAPAYNGLSSSGPDYLDSAQTTNPGNFSWNWDNFKLSNPLTSFPFELFKRWGIRKFPAVQPLLNLSLIHI